MDSSYTSRPTNSRWDAKPRGAFRTFAHIVADWTGSPYAFLLALLVVVVWLVTGPIFNYSDTWQLVINTGTTVATFLMVFVIQNVQNRDARAIHLKLDELIRGLKGARTELVELEALSDEELERLHGEFHALHQKLQIKIADRQSRKRPGRR